MDFSSLIIVEVLQLAVLFTLLFVLLRHHAKNTSREILAVNEAVEYQRQNLETFSQTVASRQDDIKKLSGLIESQENNLNVISDTIKTQQQQLASMIETATRQQKNIETMEKRIVEIEKVGNLYRSLLDELPGAVEKYKKMMTLRRKEAEAECEVADAQNDQELKAFIEKEMEGINVREKLIEELPDMILRFQEIMEPINARLKLFSDSDRYGSGSILSYSAKRAKAILASLGKQSIADRPKELEINENLKKLSMVNESTK
jgi:chromosome segregation ATPase